MRTHHGIIIGAECLDLHSDRMEVTVEVNRHPIMTGAEAIVISQSSPSDSLDINNLNNFKEAVGQWHVREFGSGRATRAQGRKLLEEAAEFFTNPCEEEAADVLITLLGIAYREDWDIEKAFLAKLEKLSDHARKQASRDRDRPLVAANKEQSK